MFHKSIRFRLQVWYGAILLAVLLGFGITAYQLERDRIFRAFDSELSRRSSILASVLRPPPRNRPPGPRPIPPIVDEIQRPDDLEERPEPRPPFDRPPDGPPRRPRPFLLPANIEALFEGENPFYFVIWGRNGEEIVRSKGTPLGDLPALPTFPGPVQIEMRGQWRESISQLLLGETILVGRTAQPQLEELARARWRYFAVGSVVALFGLAGGWWIASRAIRPIEDISAAAIQIANGNLSRRIDTRDTDSELGKLASVLNTTFARLESAFTQQTRFTADAAHELRTPVSVLLTQTQATLAREREPGEYRETIEAVQRATQRMRRLIESLLALARLDANRDEHRAEELDLSAIASECVEDLAPLAAERGIIIHRNLTEALCLGDPEQLRQVVTNLLSNAIHYNRDDGQITIQTRRDPDQTTLTIRDNGIGIAEEDLPHVFDRFFRAEKSRTAGRTGLGLSIVRAIVEKHRGTISVTSQIGETTEIEVRLPRPP